jgi:Holliday junction resolvase-like predicted endonuclease
LHKKNKTKNKKKKYRIIEKNWCHKSREINITAQDCAVTVFVDVCTRQKNAFVSGYFSITRMKKSAIKPVFQAYINLNYFQYFRFDVVEIVLDWENAEMFHYENVPFVNIHT